MTGCLRGNQLGQKCADCRNQPDDLRSYIASAVGAEIATWFADGIIDHIATLSAFPKRGTSRSNPFARVFIVVRALSAIGGEDVPCREANRTTVSGDYAR